MRRIRSIFAAINAEINMYIHQHKQWPSFTWDTEELAGLLTEARYKQGRILGKMEGLGFHLKEEATLNTLTLDVIKSSEIEGEVLNPEQVRSSIARRLGIDVAGLIPSDRNVDGIVEMMLDATQHYQAKLTEDRLFGWQASLFPTGRSGMYKIVVGGWRDNTKDDPMQVISGALGRKKVHYQAPDSDLLSKEMSLFINWFNEKNDIDPVLKAGIAHLWFVMIHPFDDGNGRIARAITDMQLARADGSAQRFYSISAQIRNERNGYYDTLENTQKGSLDITQWLTWFISCFDRALSNTDQTLGTVMKKVKFWELPKTNGINERQRLLLNKMLDGFEGKLTSSKWARIAKCSQDTATRDIQDLIDRGLLVKDAAGGRSTSYHLAKLN
jgi:Fic family protein